MNLKKISLFFQKNINYLILITFALIIFSITFGSSLLEMLRLIKIKTDLINQIKQSEEISSQLDEEIAQIGTQSYIERIARQYLELYYPNEQIVIPVENNLKNQGENKSKDTVSNPNETTPSEENTEEVLEEPSDSIDEEENIEDLTPEEEIQEPIDQTENYEQ